LVREVLCPGFQHRVGLARWHVPSAFFGIYLGRGRPSRYQVFTLELFPGGRPAGRPPNPESIIADDQKSLVLLFDPDARLLFGSIQAKVMTAIGHKAGFINGLESRRAGSSEKLRGLLGIDTTSVRGKSIGRMVLAETKVSIDTFVQLLCLCASGFNQSS
jgi:hypothetical protein